MLTSDLKIARSEMKVIRMINKHSKIFITGHKGLVGSSVYSLLEKKVTKSNYE